MPGERNDTDIAPNALQVGGGATPARPLFLERQIYRQRRLIDAARWLPLAGLVLFLTPALLLGTPSADSEGGITAVRLIYFFAVWLCLIAASAVITKGLVRGEGDREAPSTLSRDPGERGQDA